MESIFQIFWVTIFLNFKGDRVLLFLLLRALTPPRSQVSLALSDEKTRALS